MRILYGVQGTGNGHITRARLLCSALRLQGIEVDVLMSGRAGTPPKVPEFGDYRSLKGLSFLHQHGRIDRWATLKQLSLVSFAKDVAQLDLSGYDLLINDFEPVSAWAAKRQGLTSLSISHQAAFLYDIPSKDMGLWNRLLTRYFAPCEYNLGVHWCSFNQAIIPPLVANLEHLSNNGKILVYLPFESLVQVCQLLGRFTGYQFICYHPDIKQVQKRDNIQLQPIAREGFIDDLSACAGVFCNAGFELPSEAMAAGKKLLVKPLFGQFEQLSNAYTLQSLGLGQIADSLEPYILDAWLQQDRSEPVHFPDVAKILAEQIKNQQWQDLTLLAKQMWQQVSYPAVSQMSLDNMLSDYGENVGSWAKIKVLG